MAQLKSASDLPAGRQVSAQRVKKMYSVYVLRSLKTNRRYVGLTNSLNRRIEEHNSGKNRSTKGFSPWSLMYCEKFENRIEARNREKHLKSGVGRAYLDKILKE